MAKPEEAGASENSAPEPPGNHSAMTGLAVRLCSRYTSSHALAYTIVATRKASSRLKQRDSFCAMWARNFLADGVSGEFDMPAAQDTGHLQILIRLA